MDGGVADVHYYRNISIAKAVKTVFADQLVRELNNLVPGRCHLLFRTAGRFLVQAGRYVLKKNKITYLLVSKQKFSKGGRDNPGGEGAEKGGLPGRSSGHSFANIGILY